MQVGLIISKVWSDNTIFELGIQSTDAFCSFATTVFCDRHQLAVLIEALATFATQATSGPYELMLGKNGPSSAGGSYQAKLKYFGLNGSIGLTISAESPWRLINGESSASMATLHFRADPSSLDSFLKDLAELHQADNLASAVLIGRSDS